MAGLALVARQVLGAGGASGGPVAIHVAGGRIAAVVPATEAAALHAARVVDLGDATLLPGFVDAHVHLTPTGLATGPADLRDVRSAAELLHRVRATAVLVGPMVWLDGYDETTFATPALPAPEQLAEAAGGRPVYCSRVDGHQALASASLLEQAGVLDADGVERIEGLPTGLIRDDANHRARAFALERLADVDIMAAQDAALALAARRGVTSVHEMGGPDICSRRDFEVLLRRLGTLPLEVVPYWGAFDLERVLAWGLPRIGGDLFLDGSLGARTAWLSAPYADAPAHLGSSYRDDAELTGLYVDATRADVQVGVHVIGDAAVAQALRCASAAAVEVGLEAFAARRHRLEHLELLPQGAVPELARLGLTASVQPAFDAAWGGPGGMYEQRLGAGRAAGMNRFADLLRAGIRVAGSSDSHVTPLDPWVGIAAGVHHSAPEQRLSLQQALAMFTSGGRWLAFAERESGTIGKGMRADLTAVTGDALATDPRERIATDALLTLVAGRLVHGPAELDVESARGPRVAPAPATPAADHRPRG